MNIYLLPQKKMPKCLRQSFLLCILEELTDKWSRKVHHEDLQKNLDIKHSHAQSNKNQLIRGNSKYLSYYTLSFAAACSATSCMDSGDTVRKNPAI
jgi:hypothetical protein